MAASFLDSQAPLTISLVAQVQIIDSPRGHGPNFNNNNNNNHSSLNNNNNNNSSSLNNNSSSPSSSSSSHNLSSSSSSRGQPLKETSSKLQPQPSVPSQ
jgi:hypothetical protein